MAREATKAGKKIVLRKKEENTQAKGKETVARFVCFMVIYVLCLCLCACSFSTQVCPCTFVCVCAMSAFLFCVPICLFIFLPVYVVLRSGGEMKKE